MVSLAADSWTRLRYRRAELFRLVPASLAAPSTTTHVPLRWVSPDGDPGGAASTLASPVGGRVTYHVTLPSDTRIRTQCSVAPHPANPVLVQADIEFTLQATVDGHVSQQSCRIGSAGERRALELRLAEGGAATLVLSTSAHGPISPDTRVLWRNPRAEWPRPMRDVTAALGRAARRRSFGALASHDPSIDAARRYRLWVRESEPSARTLQSQRERSAGGQLLLTLITVRPRGTAGGRSRTLKSLAGQSYPHWEWLAVLDVGSGEGLKTPAPQEDTDISVGIGGRSTAAPGSSVVAPGSSGPGGPRIAGGDPRARIVSVDPETTDIERLNLALAAARGEFVALIDDGDLLSPSALFEMAKAAAASAGVDVLYSDEDHLDDSGNRVRPFFKPEWSPELLLATNYVGRLALIRRSTALGAGGFRAGFGGAFEWELLLRLSRAGASFRRIAACLYHRHEPAAAPDAPSVDAMRDRAAVLTDHGNALGLEVEVSGPASAACLRWPLGDLPTVSIVVPNRNAFAVLETCVRGVLDGTSYPNRELVVVDNGSTDADVLALYAGLERERRGRVVPFDRPFNFSAACNAGAAAATGDLLLFLNNDIEVIDPAWLEEMVRWAQRPGIGVVGAQLLYPDRLIQHAGVVFGLGLVGHVFARAAEGTDGVFGSSSWYRNYLAVTGACQMLPRTVFDRLGGFDERLRISFSDVILCLEAWRAGYRVVYTPHARLVHHESFTRKRDDSVEDMEYFAAYLRRTNFVEDPYLHPQLDPNSLVPLVRPPFEPSPRQVIAEYVGRVLAVSAGR